MVTYRHWSVSLWWDPDDVPHCRSCPLTKLNGGLCRLHSEDEDAVSWLTNYGSWHAYEKKKKNARIRFVDNLHLSDNRVVAVSCSVWCLFGFVLFYVSRFICLCPFVFVFISMDLHGLIQTKNEWMNWKMIPANNSAQHVFRTLCWKIRKATSNIRYIQLQISFAFFWYKSCWSTADKLTKRLQTSAFWMW